MGLPDHGALAFVCRVMGPREGQAGRVATSFPEHPVHLRCAPTSGTGNATPSWPINLLIDSTALWPHRLHQQKTSTPSSASRPSVTAGRPCSARSVALRLNPPMPIALHRLYGDCMEQKKNMY